MADWKIQGALCLRLAIYWCVCQSTFILTILGFQFLHGMSGESAAGTSSPWQFIVPAAIVSSCALPVILLDLLIFSNRFAGPLFRLKRHLHELARGSQPPEFRPRTGDYYQDLISDLNTVQKRLAETRSTGDATAAIDDGSFAAMPHRRAKVGAHR
jgi:hypothetical protein